MNSHSAHTWSISEVAQNTNDGTPLTRPAGLQYETAVDRAPVTTPKRACVNRPPLNWCS
ncbi:MAG: hypothetical protein WA117_16855 [Verrucomicrobiia bacterium]